MFKIQKRKKPEPQNTVEEEIKDIFKFKVHNNETTIKVTVVATTTAQAFNIVGNYVDSWSFKSDTSPAVIELCGKRTITPGVIDVQYCGKFA